MKYINDNAAEFRKIDEQNYDLFEEKGRLSDYESWALSQAVKVLFTKETTEWWYTGSRYSVDYYHGDNLEVEYDLVHTQGDNLILKEFNTDNEGYMHIVGMWNLKMK